MSISDIYCQGMAVETLNAALDAGRLAHAYIFAGIEGVGKFTTAKEWAKMLLCQAAVDNDSCGQCDSCKLMEADNHPDFHHIRKELLEFTKDGKNKKPPTQLPINVIREFLLDKVSAKPGFGDYSVYVVSETEKLNAESQNAMLKVLEEPPSHCFIILLCSSPDKLLPTTRSRCQIVSFGSIDEQIIIDKLVDLDIDEEQSRFWARFTNGSIGQSIKWGQLDAYDIKTELVEKLAKLDIAGVAEFAVWIGEAVKELAERWSQIEERVSKIDLKRRVQKGIVAMMVSAMSDAMKTGVDFDNGLTNSEQARQIRRLAERLGPEQAAAKIAKGYQAIKMIDSSVNEKLIFEQLLISYSR